MKLKIITVGNKPKSNTQGLIDDFQKRLPNNIVVTWHYVKNASLGPEASKQHEAESVLRGISDNDYVVLLDEVGQQISSPQLSEIIFDLPKNIIFIIGGAYGVDRRVVERADFVWSLGLLVYPHQLVRIILSEQIYRAYTISVGHPYHHG